MKNKKVTPKENSFYWLYLVGFFLILALPLLNLPPWFSPPDWGKTIVFRIILSILIFIFLYQILFRKDNTFSTTVKNVLHRGNKVFWAFCLLVLLLLVFLLATILSLDSHFSLWGSPYRSGGFLNFAFYIILAILAFLIIRKNDWQKICDFVILIGIFVSLIAILQWQGLFKGILITFELRPPSTIGGPIFLAIYLLLLSFLTLSFGLREKNLKRKVFYFFAFCLFLFVIFITLSRAGFFGVIIGVLYFLFFYPKGVIWIKISALILLIAGVCGYLYIMEAFGYFDIIPGSQQFPSFIQKNETLRTAISRTPVITIASLKETSRVSGWRVSLSAIKTRPILGYGPENFAVGFDKYYDPSLPGIEKIPGGIVTTWWDRAHNFIFDIGITAGIPVLIIYLSLFGVLFWQLQKLKYTEQHKTEHRTTQKVIIYHGIQATFIGYLVANFFSFDTFSSYLILFLLISFSLYLISEQKAHQFINDRSGTTRIKTRRDAEKIGVNQRNYQRKSASTSIFFKWRGIIILLLFMGLLWFIYFYNIKPFQINTQINVAKYLVDKGQCEQALARMENILSERSFLDSYLRLKYADFLKNCEDKIPEGNEKLAQKGYEILKENIKIQPYFTRNWLMLGAFTNVLIEKKTGLIEEEQNPETVKNLKESVENLKNEANSYFEKAFELSPKRQEVFIEWIKLDLVSGEYQKAKEKSQKCIDLNPKVRDCYWLLSLSQIFLGELEKAKENISIAYQKGYPIDSFESLNQLAEAYTVVKNYQELAIVFQKLIQLKPEEPQYHATLAFIYKELGQYEKAREEAMIVLQLLPEAKEEVELFLQQLR